MVEYSTQAFNLKLTDKSSCYNTIVFEIINKRLPRDRTNPLPRGTWQKQREPFTDKSG